MMQVTHSLAHEDDDGDLDEIGDNEVNAAS